MATTVQRAKRLSSVKPRVSAEATSSAPPSSLLVLENGRLSESLTAANELTERIAAENQQLQRDASERERENFEVGEYLRKDLADRKRELAELNEHKQEAERMAEQQLQELRQQHAAEREEADARAAETEAALRHHVQELEGRLASVAGFREQQGSIAREMQYLRSERDRAKQEVADQAKAHAAAQQQLRAELQEEHRQSLTAAAAEHAASLEANLDAQSAIVHQENQRLKAELAVHTQENVYMHAKLKVLRESQQVLQREVTLQQGLEAQFAQRSALQAREITAAKKEAATMAGKLAEADARFQTQLRAAQEAAAADRAAAEAEQDMLRRMVELKGRELKHLKALSQAVIQQRSDIEVFLLSSLEMVQAEVAKGQNARRAAVREETSPAADAMPLAQHVDMRDLTWEDREKVLRLLFAKLNDPKQQAFFERLPAHIQA